MVRLRAQAAAEPGSWLDMVLSQHVGIEAAFARVAEAAALPERRAAQRKLSVLLSGHSNAEEAVIYPALALNSARRQAEMGYCEQSATKIEMAALDELDPTSGDYLDKLEQVRDAVAHHVYEEESVRFLDLMDKLSPAAQIKLTQRYTKAYERCVRGSTAPSASQSLA